MNNKHAVPASNPRPVTKREYTNTAFAGGANQQSDRLSGRSKQVVDYVMDHLAAADYQSACSLTEMAEHFGMMPGTLRMTLRGPLDLDLLSIKRNVVYPTVKLLQRAEPCLGMDAAAILVLQLAR
jgi:hypothetical protein